MGFFLQLKLLLWKNFTLRKRQWFRLTLEIVSPLLLFLILVIVRTRPDLKESHPECHFDGKAMPSAGVLPFLQTMFCTFNNTCHTQVTEDERAGSIQSFNQSLLTALVRDFEIILGNRDDLKLLEDAAADISTLSALLRMLNNQNTTGGINVGNILINPSNFSQQLQQQNISLTSQVTQQLLSASLIPSRINMSMIAEILGDLDTCAIPNSSHLSNITNAVNMTGLPTSLPQTNTSVLPNSVSDLQRLLCAEGRLAQILQFADSQTANNVQSQVCNLTTEDFLRFVNTFRDDIDIQNLEKEVRSFILMNVGRELLSDPSNFLERIQQIGQEVRNFYYDYRRAVSNELDRQDLLKPLSDLRSLMSGQAGAQSFGQLLCGRNFPDGIIDTTGISQSLNSTTQRFANTFAVQSVLVNDDDDDDDDINQSSERKCNHTHSRPPWRSRRCRNLISSFTSTRSGSTLWKQLLPFVRGYIHYYPDTPEVRKIIEESNKTFDGIASFGQFAIELSTYAIELENVTSFLVMFTNSCYCDLLVNAALGFDTSSIPSVLPLPLNASTIDSIINMAKNLSQSVNGSACKYVHNLLVSNPVNVNGSIDPGNMGQFINVAGIVKLVQEMASSIGGYIQCLNYQKFVPFNDYETFMSESQKQISSGYLWGALQFDKVLMDKAGKPQYVEYRIRMDPKKVDSTKKIRDKYWRPGPRRDFWDTKYTLYGFSYLQDMIDHAIIRLQTESKEDVGIYLQMFPYPCYTEDKFVFAISRSLPLFLVLAWILTVALICKNIVHEKEVRLKEVMKIMGLGNGVHWVAWFINAFVIMFLTIILLTIVVKGGKVIEFSDASVLMVFFTVFAISTIMQCFLVSTFFNRANLAACCAGFIYFVLYLPYTLAIQWEEYMTNGHKFLACLSSSVAFGFGCSYIARYEEQGVGIQWSNIAETPVVDDQFNMLYCIFLMIFDSVLYGIATWYIEAVFPGQYGIPRKFYFPFQKSYWCGGSSGSKDSSANYIVGESTIDLQNRDARNFETEPVTRALGVSIRNLKKVYHQGNKTAVDGLSLNFYEGQITSFLGHNGAGKTTTMSILTGLFPPTDGTAYIYGKDIRTNMDDIRKSIGMCPQYNVLFDHLTVEEHMWFYARLRGLSSDQVKTEMEQMIKDVGLPHKRKEVSSSLSGGMKRKLSVAIAFVGGAKTVILDEPTAGVDPYARRSIWELLFKVKKDRTIILSTHHMDEADVLGDRIAIISQGKLCCCGSSLFLKSRYGNGYYLTMVRSSDKEDEDYDNGDDFKKADLTANGSIDNVEKLLNFDDRPSTAGSQKSGTSVRTVIEIGPCIGETEDEGYQESLTGKSDSSDSLTPPPEGSTMLPGYSVKRITSFVQKYVHDSQLVEENNTELIFRLPDEGSENGQFQRLFKQLEKCHKDLGISSFGISDTSLEEVFLKVTEGTLDELDDEYLRTRQEETSDGGRYPKSVTRLSFRRKKKKSFLKILQEKSKRSKRRVDSSTTDLMGDTDSVVSEPVSDMGDKGFNHKEMKKIQGKMLYVRQLIAILIRRFHHVRRSKKGFLCEIILPAVFILLAMIFSELTPPVAEEPKLELHPWMYVPKLGDQFLYMFYSNDGFDASEAQKSINMMLRKPGIGNRCLNDSLHTIDDYPCPTSWRKEEPVSFANSYGSAHYPQCSCTTGQQVCPEGAGGPVPPMAILPTSDRLFNMTSRNVSDWLVKTYHKYMKRRYGGFSFGDVDYRGIEAMKTISNASKYVNFTSPDWKWFKDLFSRDVNKIWYDNKGWAAIVIYTNVMNNILMRSKSTPGLLHPTNRGIVTHNHPIEYTQTQLEDKLMTSSAIDIVIAICVIFAMSFIPASFTLVLIEERASNSKHLQFVSGVNPTIYWISNFLWDLLNYLVPCMLMLIIFKAFNRQAYVGDMNGGCLVALLCLYGWAMIPLMYPFTRLFSVPSTAMVTLQAANIFLGTTTTLATYIITFLEEDDEDLKAINNLLKKIFLIFPQYCLGRGLMDMSTNYLYSMAYTSFGFEDSRSIDPFEFDQVGKNLLSLFIIGIGFFVFNILIEYNFCIRRGLFSRIFLRKPVLADLSDEDVDVAAERRRVLDGTAANDVLRIEELVKVYPVKAKKGRNTAVDRLCVGVPKGQCFGLLGVNGAGKTTTFKMLTGDVTVSQGDAYVNGYSILRDRVQVNRSIGYCPQFDAFDNLLTGREILSFFARLRGVPEKEIKEVAEWAIRKLNLKQYADKIADGYSGGNKRKLSTAISLIGNPSIIFLDEPTTGMDPRARRFLWNCINAIVRDGRSVILTSHSMEECEALCNRLGIMVNGSFKCLGSPQHLKNRFGDGYTVIIRVAGGRTNIKSIKRYISRNFPGSELREEHNNMVQYQMPGQILLSYLFQQIEAVKEEYSIEDYSVSQTTLDHVFINFAKMQTDLLDDVVEEKKKKADVLKLSQSNDVESQMDEESRCGSTVELFGSRRSQSDVDNIYQMDARSELTEEESLAGSQVDLIRPAKKDEHDISFSNTRDRSVPSIDIF